jgi:hypothetical protein
MSRMTHALMLPSTALRCANDVRAQAGWAASAAATWAATSSAVLSAMVAMCAPVEGS